MTRTATQPSRNTAEEPTARAPTPPIDAKTLAAFEDRYGEGAYARLAALLGQPCVTFAQIAERFGVSRERVRQWHRRFLPDATTGHDRQRLCVLRQRRRRLFQDELFRAFFRHARDHFGPGRIEPVRSRDGYFTRLVRVDKRLVALRDGADVAAAWQPSSFRYRGRAEFVFVRLGNDEFLFFPAKGQRAQGRSASRVSVKTSLRNSFVALGFPEDESGSTSEMANSACGDAVKLT